MNAMTGETKLKVAAITYSEMVQADRKLDPSALIRATPLAVALGGNCNMSFLSPSLRVSLADEGIAASVFETAYDGWIASAIAPAQKTDLWLLWFSSLGQSDGGTARRELNLDAILSGVAAIIARSERVVAIMPEALESGSPYSQFDLWRRQMTAALDSQLPEAVIRIDPDHVHRALGDARWHAGRYWTLAKSPCHPDAAALLGNFAANVIARLLKPKVKAVAVDLDGTLWGGIVGEAGTNGVSLDPHGEGRPYLQLQRFLKDLSERGVPISVVSKNNEADALAPFAARDEMILKREDFVYFHANWNTKAESIKQIAANLNIGIDTLCFIDDSIHERAEARALLPNLIVPELPADPEARLGFLTRSGLFTQPLIAADDLARVDYYKSQARRETLAVEAGDVGAYLRSLEMKLQPMPVGPANMQRVASLIHKTNQFNLTNRRHSEAILSGIAGTPENFAFCYKLADRFGDAGIIAVVLGLPQNGELFVDTWLMSCRVINRTVEEAICDHLFDWCRQRGIQSVRGLYVPSEKNALVASLYSRLGFEPSGEDSEGKLFTARGAPAPQHSITILTN